MNGSFERDKNIENIENAQGVGNRSHFHSNHDGVSSHVQGPTQTQNRIIHQTSMFIQGETNFEDASKLHCTEENFLQQENGSSCLQTNPTIMLLSQSSMSTPILQSQSISQSSHHNIGLCSKESSSPLIDPLSTFNSLPLACPPSQIDENDNSVLLQPSVVVQEWDPSYPHDSEQNAEDISGDPAHELLQMPQIPQLNIHSPPPPPTELLQRPQSELSPVLYFSPLESTILSNQNPRTSTSTPSLASPGVVSTFSIVPDTTSNTSDISLSNVFASNMQLRSEKSVLKFPSNLTNSSSVSVIITPPEKESSKLQNNNNINNNNNNCINISSNDENNFATENRKRKNTDPLFFFENPLHLVNPQTKYRRNQLHLDLVNSCIYESDFSESEGIITIWRLKEYNPIDTTNYSHTLFTMEPAAILYGNYVSRVLGDQNNIYCIYGGEGLWLSWWDTTTLKEEKYNFTPRLKLLVSYICFIYQV